ncbi:hypothetical protein LJK88_10950 [Paenibacillus sp. P26]|nr:hypothetical protein LJK88_10950 [Paenibacillus sp. P26]
MVSGLFFGLAFGLGGIGSVVLGRMIDSMGVTSIIQICSWSPLLGIFALWRRRKVSIQV